MIVSFAPSLFLAVSGTLAAEPVLRPPPHAAVLNAQQIRALLVGSVMVDPNGPDSSPATLSFNRNGTFASSAFGVIFTFKRGRYQFKGDRVCVEEICSVIARDRQGYLLGTAFQGRWNWSRRKIARQGV
jgi:hypothetical protein